MQHRPPVRGGSWHHATVSRRACRSGVLRAWLVVVAMTAMVGGARGEPHAEAALVWQAPGGCPDSAEVVARIEGRLGLPLERAVHGVAVEIAVENRRFVARIDLRAITVANEMRVLSSERCDELADAVAVVIARIAAEQRAADEVRAPQAVRMEQPAPAAPPARWGGGVRLQTISGIGTLPGVGLGGELAGHVRRHEWYAELSAARWMPQSRFLHVGAPGRVDVRLDALALRVGYQSQRLPLRGYVTGEVGSVIGEGVSLDFAEMGNARWVAVGGGFAVAWGMTRHLRLVGVLETLVPLERARFLLQDGGVIFRPDPLAVRSGLGFEVGW